MVYKDPLEIEFGKLGIPFACEKTYSIVYKEQVLKHYFIADFIAYNAIILEIKVGNYIGEPYLKQTLNYLKASGLRLGIVINFGTSSVEHSLIIF